MSTPYKVFLADRCGEFNSKSFTTFEEALVAYRDQRKRYPNGVSIGVVNEEACDYDHNGLTEDEAEELF